MKNTAQKLPFSSRFLIGICISLSLVLTAFEWKTYDKISNYFSPNEITNGEDVILPPVTYRTEKLEKPKPKKSNSDQIQIVFDLPRTVDSLNNQENQEKVPDIDPDKFGMSDEPLAYEPLPFAAVETFPHYGGCEGLLGIESEECSQLIISNKVKSLFVLPPMLRDAGGKHLANIKFTVDKNGNVKDVEVLESNSTALSKAAIKAVQSLPQLIPAIQQGHRVAIEMNVPIVVDIKN